MFVAYLFTDLLVKRCHVVTRFDKTHLNSVSFLEYITSDFEFTSKNGSESLILKISIFANRETDGSCMALKRGGSMAGASPWISQALAACENIPTTFSTWSALLGVILSLMNNKYIYSEPWSTSLFCLRLLEEPLEKEKNEEEGGSGIGLTCQMHELQAWDMGLILSDWHTKNRSCQYITYLELIIIIIYITGWSAGEIAQQ